MLNIFIPDFISVYFWGGRLMSYKKRCVIVLFVVIAIFSLLFPTLCFSQTTGTNSTTSEDVSNKKDNSKGLFSDIATEEKSDKDGFLSKEPTSSNNFLPMLILLFFIIGVIYFIVRWVTKKRNISFVGSEFAKVEGTKTLAMNKYLQLVKIGNKHYILGIADHSVNLIMEITDKEQLDSIMIDVNKSKPLKPFIEQFKTSIKNMLGMKSKTDKDKKTTLIKNSNTKISVNDYSTKEIIEKENTKKNSENSKNDKIIDDKFFNDEKDSSEKIYKNSTEKSNNFNDLLIEKSKINQKNEEKTYQMNKNSKILYENKDNTEKKDSYRKISSSEVDNKLFNMLNESGLLEKINEKDDKNKKDDEIINDNNFDFIKKQRERLANLGIDINIKKD